MLSSAQTDLVYRPPYETPQDGQPRTAGRSSYILRTTESLVREITIRFFLTSGDDGTRGVGRSEAEHLVGAEDRAGSLVGGVETYVPEGGEGEGSRSFRQRR